MAADAIAMGGAERASAERRRSPRSETSRRVFFTEAKDVAFLREGSVVDMSGVGLQIRTATPAPPGSSLHVEMPPCSEAEKSRPIAATGRVVRVVPLGNRSFAMGVRLRIDPLHDRPAQRVLAGRLPSAAGGFAFPRVAGVGPADADAEAGTSDTKRSRRRRPLAALALLLLLMVCLLLWPGPDADPSAHTAARRGGDIAADGMQSEVRAPGTTSRVLWTADDSPGQRHALGAGDTVPNRTVARSGQPWPGPGRPGSPARIPAGIAEAPPAEGRPLGTLPEPLASFSRNAPRTTGPADSVASRARNPMRSMSRRATGPSAALPDAPETPRGGPLESGRLEPLVYEEELAPPPNDVLVHIDKSDFALTVFVNGAPRHRFPVGLGLLDATPTGEFNIGNKIADPDWHSGSEVVKAGDPRNPLGAFWMGLSDGRGSTSYGLHPTGDPHSIGRLSSRGCIRMRPSDAQTLYRMCPIGTPVRICR